MMFPPPSHVHTLDEHFHKVAENNALYGPLMHILTRAYDQSASGKGSERHANGKSWVDQPILQITRSKGLGFPAGQADKKITEALGMVARGEHDKAVNELLGAIVYVAALIHRIEEMRE